MESGRLHVVYTILEILEGFPERVGILILVSNEQWVEQRRSIRTNRTRRYYSFMEPDGDVETP